MPNLSTLKTLTRRQYISGLGEVVKAGLIKDKDFYNWLKNNKELINVATSRARDKLIVLADTHNLKRLHLYLKS